MKWLVIWLIMTAAVTESQSEYVKSEPSDFARAKCVTEFYAPSAGITGHFFNEGNDIDYRNFAVFETEKEMRTFMNKKRERYPDKKIKYYYYIVLK